MRPWNNKQVIDLFESSERYRIDCARDPRMQLGYALLVLFQPTQGRRNHNTVKVLLFATSCSDADRGMFISPSFHEFHYSIELKVRLCKRYRRDPRQDLLVIGWDEAIVCYY